MIIKSIQLTNFRNHSDYQLDFNPDTTLILGENGCGKTSVLEAIYIALRGKSFRATDPDIIKYHTDYYRINLKTSNDHQIIVTYDNKAKTFILMDKKTKRLPKNQKYPIVLFLPSDLNLISGSPSRRRDYFNHFFSMLSEEYSLNLSRYEKALRQRNEALKSNNPSPASLFSWNVLLAKYGIFLSSFRKELIIEINQRLGQIYSSITNNNDSVELIYQTDIKTPTEANYLNTLEANFEKDVILGHTSFGIHRDDFGFIFNQKTAENSASRGESRSLILALKFIEAEIIYQKLQQKPLILLDDVFSELDQTHRHCLIDNFKNHQVIITSVEDINR